MKFTQSQIDEMVAHARDDVPNECCGLVAAKDGAATTVHRAVNAAASPLRYEIDSADYLRIYKLIDEADEEVGAIYHSHTRSAAYPSQTDINLALWPDALYIIVSLAADEPDVKAFAIVDRKVEEVTLEIV
ncbi:MAG: M67 family metallopeptidase [Solirubrobacterales bacterium]